MEQFQAKISGYVQGVCFRADARHEAKALGLVGYVKNLLSGDVEVLAQGDKQNLEQFLSWLHKGPSGARVDEVKVEWDRAKNIQNDFLIEF